MNIQLNLATRYYIDFRKVNLSIAFLYIILILWLITESYFMLSNYDEIRRLSAGNKNLSAAKTSENISAAEYNKTLESIKYFNSILERRSYDWLKLLDNMESVVPAGVSLTGLVPDEKNNTIKLNGMARNFTSVRVFIENIQNSTNFTDVFLVSHSINNVKSNKFIIFSVTCRATN